MSEGLGQARAVAAHEERLRLSFAAGALDVIATDAGALGWLAEFMGPAFRPVAAGPEPGTPAIVYGIDRDLHGRLGRRLAADAALLEVFTQDGSFSRHRSLIGDDGWRWVHDEGPDAFVGVTNDGRTARVVVARAGPLQRLALMRVVRELATTALLRAGHLPVHGAAFVYDRGAVLLCGPKRAGKTSSLVHALSRGGIFLSNDRLFVDLASGAEATGMPTIVMLRDGTLALFGELARRLGSARFDRGRTLAECAPDVARPDPETRPGFDRPGISPAQLCRVLDAPMCGSAPVARILFPAISREVGGLELVPMAPHQARGCLAQSLLKPSHPTRVSALFAAAGAREIDAAEEADRCRILCERVPAFECRLGPRAFEGDLLQALHRSEA